MLPCLVSVLLTFWVQDVLKFEKKIRRQKVNLNGGDDDEEPNHIPGKGGGVLPFMFRICHASLLQTFNYLYKIVYSGNFNSA